MHELEEKYEAMKESLVDLQQKKTKLEANVEMSKKKLAEIDDKIREKLDIEPEELESWIKKETKAAEGALKKAEKKRGEAAEKLAEIEAKLRGTE